jgi:hypothetical protein
VLRDEQPLFDEPSHCVVRVAVGEQLVVGHDTVTTGDEFGQGS